MLTLLLLGLSIPQTPIIPSEHEPDWVETEVTEHHQAWIDVAWQGKISIDGKVFPSVVLKSVFPSGMTLIAEHAVDCALNRDAMLRISNSHDGAAVRYIDQINFMNELNKSDPRERLILETACDSRQQDTDYSHSQHEAQ